MPAAEKLEINDSSGVLKNINDLLEEHRKGNLEALAIVYTRKNDHSTRSFRFGRSRVMLVGTLEQMKFDILELDSERCDVIDYEGASDDEET